MNKTIFVYENWSGEEPALLGRLYAETGRRESFSFEYDSRWLKTNGAGVVLDPDLNLYRGRQYTPLGKNLFGLFADSCPDRWGRLLMQRREAIQARKEDRKPARLFPGWRKAESHGPGYGRGTVDCKISLPA